MFSSVTLFHCCCCALLLPKKTNTNWSWVWTHRPALFSLIRSVNILPSLYIKYLLLLDSVTCATFITAETNSTAERAYPVGVFNATPSFPDLYMSFSSFPFLSLLGCCQASARKVMEQGKMVCTSVGWQRWEDAISLYSLNYRNLNALWRACSSAADVLYGSLIPSVQPVWARQHGRALFTGFHWWS